MGDLFWPGTERAGDLMSEPALLHAMVRVEAAWLDALVVAEVAEPAAADDLVGLVTADDVAGVAERSEATGSPVGPLLSLLRDRLRQRNAATAFWLHRGLTSQDVVDTALMLCTVDVLAQLRADLTAQIAAVAGLADRYRGCLMVARTLTQHAVPITFGLKAAMWLQGILDAAEDLDGVGKQLPSQIGGAAGSLAAPAELAARSGLDDPAGQARLLAARASRTLGLLTRAPWHTARAPITRLGDAFVRCTDAWGRVAGDVLTLSRSEIAELAEPTMDGRGSSSTMPQKTNPVLSVLIRRAALAAPSAAAGLHLAAAESQDERPDGAWHLEWPTLQLLARRVLVASSQATELLTGLNVDTGRMRGTLAAVSDTVLAERRCLPSPLGGSEPRTADDPAGYLGAADLIIDEVIERARRHSAAAR